MSASFICDEENNIIEIPHYFPSEDEVIMKVRNMQVNKLSEIYFQNSMTQKIHFESAITCTV